MEHELLKMPDLESKRTDSATGKPEWDCTFWSVDSHKRTDNTAESSLVRQIEGSSTERPRKDESFRAKLSWKQTLRIGVQDRLRKLREEEREDLLNNAAGAEEKQVNDFSPLRPLEHK